MITLRFLRLSLLFLALIAESRAADAAFKVATFETEWRDSARDRVVPVKIYYPSDATVPCPVIVFSHGLGGSREGYRYLGEAWAAHGYISVHVQHAGSDTDAIRGLRMIENFRKAAADPANAVNRPLDIRFAIDRLAALNADDAFPLHGRMDLVRLGVAGHSYGAFTTMAVTGARIPILGNQPRYLDPRIKAAIAMSTPNTPGNETDAAFDAVRIPIFHMTGTEDGSPGKFASVTVDAVVGNTPPIARRRPFDHTCNAIAYLLTFTGGDHMVFSGRMTGKRAKDAEFQALICSGSITFWDAYLKNDTAALRWLETDGFATALGKLGSFEQKHP